MLIWRKGFKSGQSEKIFLFSIRKSDITVWFRCFAVELIIKDCNDDKEEEEEREIRSKKKKTLETQEVEDSIRKERKGKNNKCLH